MLLASVSTGRLRPSRAIAGYPPSASSIQKAAANRAFSAAA